MDAGAKALSFPWWPRLLIETRAAVDKVEDICKVERIDCLTIIPFDLPTALGASGRLNAPELVDASPTPRA